MNKKTVFQKIIDRDIPANIWYEDDSSIAFLDIDPISPGHTLFITKTPYRWIQNVPADELGTLFSKVPDLTKKLKSATDSDFIQLSVVGTDVPHFHLHLIPRNFDDNTNELYPSENLDYDREQLFAGLKS